MKAVVRHGGRVLLGRNDRGEWELPGGRPDAGESAAETVEREVAEECGLAVRTLRRMHEEAFEVLPGRRVLVVAYACALVGGDAPRPSAEHLEVRFVPEAELPGLPLPAVYRRSIAAAR